MDQTIILVDDRDKFKGYTTWKEGHYGKGKRHRGFVVLLFDEKGNVYLQKRKHRVFDGLWDLTAISHPYKVGRKEESLTEAVLRSLKNEMGIGKVELRDVGAFVYFAKDGDWCENEYCHVFIGKFDGKFKPNKKFVYEAKKVKFEEFVEDMKKNPKMFTPWAKLSVKSIESTKGNESRRFWTSQNDKQSELTEDMERFGKEFEKYAKEYFGQRAKFVRKYPALIQKFYKELEEFGEGGKLLRPYLVWLGYRIAKNDKGRSFAKMHLGKGPTLFREIMPVCMATELVHSFLLIHDDIIDRADTRRDKPTVHKKFEKLNGPHYGSSMGILVGDLALVEAWGEIAELCRTLPADAKALAGRRGTTQTELLFEKFIEVIRDTIFGEALDVEYSHSKANIDQIWQVIDLKTARYSFVGPMVLGATLGQIQGRTQKISNFKFPISNLEQYGMLVGRAYQLRDDMLAIFGDDKVTGKSGLSDMREGKNTVLLYKALEMSGQANRQFISRYWGNEKSGVKELVQIKDIFNKSGALDWCEKKLDKMVGDAGKQVEKITKDKGLQQILEELADYVAARVK